MLRYFDRISDTFSLWFDALSDRERKLVSVLFLALCILMVLTTFYVAGSKLSNKRAAITSSKKQLVEIRELEGSYLIAKEKNERALASIRRNDVSLFTYIQGISTRLGLDVKDLTEQKKALPKSKLVEEQVRINLTKLSIDRVSALIEALESSEDANAQVKVTRLKVSKRYDEPDLLDIQMTVSTWKSA